MLFCRFFFGGGDKGGVRAKFCNMSFVCVCSYCVLARYRLAIGICIDHHNDVETSLTKFEQRDKGQTKSQLILSQCNLSNYQRFRYFVIA